MSYALESLQLVASSQTADGNMRSRLMMDSRPLTLPSTRVSQARQAQGASEEDAGTFLWLDADAPWRVMPQTQRWLRACVFEAMVHDLRVMPRLAEGHTGQPSAAILDNRTLQSMPENGPSALDLFYCLPLW
jgi:hypothetical protein